MKFTYLEGATPIDPDEGQALIPSHITTQGDLNEWESQNIQRAAAWALSRKRPNILTDVFVRELHRQMFDRTWEWAGAYRRTDKNIGVHWEDVSVEVHKCLRDAEFWLAESSWSVRESAVRLHHRLVAAHPFVNGNGRHSRLFADTFLYNHNADLIDWGGSALGSPGDARSRYLRALRAADRGDYELLFQYAGL